MIARTVVAVTLLVAGAAHAQHGRDDPRLRKIFLPTVKGATDCVAREVLAEPGVVDSYRSTGGVGMALAAALNRCGGQLSYMMSEHDRLYGYGTGQDFYNGPYRNDVERAVLVRIRAELERRRDQADRAEAHRRIEEEQRRVEAQRLEAERRAEAERQAVERRAETERREAALRLERERLETERQVEQARQERAKRERKEEAERARDLVKDTMYACTAARLVSLVRSGESATILAKAAVTLCNKEVDSLLGAGFEVYRIERSPEAVSALEEVTFRDRAREVIVDNVTASAVQAKAAFISNN